MPRKKIPSIVLHHAPNVAKHQANCTVCAHPECQEIEHDFISWKSPATIAGEYKLRNRSAVYRHARAFDLYTHREKNVRAALARIIEQVDAVEITGANIIQAIAILGRLNARGELVTPQERPGMHELFSKMSPAELDDYAKNSTLPTWFPVTNETKNPQGPGGGENA